jgi:hypothetical protein
VFIPAAGRKALEALVKQLADQKCSFTVTGYTSASSPAAKRMAGGRADEVTARLVALGVDAASITTENGGMTTQYGSGAANRRVVVSVTAE